MQIVDFCWPACQTVKHCTVLLVQLTRCFVCLSFRGSISQRIDVSRLYIDRVFVVTGSSSVIETDACSDSPIEERAHANWSKRSA